MTVILIIWLTISSPIHVLAVSMKDMATCKAMSDELTRYPLYKSMCVRQYTL